MSNEIFGLILLVVIVKFLDDVICFVNLWFKLLLVYLFIKLCVVCEWVIREVLVGGMMVNYLVF